jgi:hypothetical protein
MPSDEITSYTDQDHGRSGGSGMGERLFLWITWAAAAAFLAVLTIAYLSGFFAASAP